MFFGKENHGGGFEATGIVHEKEVEKVLETEVSLD